MNKTGSSEILIRGGRVVTVDGADRVLDADLLIRDGRIAQMTEPGEAPPPAGRREVIDARGCVVLPGFVQTHVHMCQTLMRGYADDMRLLDWLGKRVWPMEAAHTPQTMRAAARLAIAEMIRGGTTTALTMETVRHTEAALRAVEESGFRAVVGKCMMDRGETVPPALLEDPAASLEESLALFEAWDGRENGRIRVAFAPRFAVSCTRGLLERVAEHAHRRGAIIHTHASETREEVELIRGETGLGNIAYLDELRLTGPRTVLAHCVWATDEEIARLAASRTAVAHCPSSNLKLGSGIAPVAEMLSAGVRVSLGADGAPCNNRLDMLTELRSAALLQKVRKGPEALAAPAALRLATIEGARALGMADEIGSVEEGKRADLILIDMRRLHLTPHPDVVSAIVYAAQSEDVRTVLIDGRVVLRDGRLTTLDEEEVRNEALARSRELAREAGSGE